MKKKQKEQEKRSIVVDVDHNYDEEIGEVSPINYNDAYNDLETQR